MAERTATTDQAAGPGTRIEPVFHKDVNTVDPAIVSEEHEPLAADSKLGRETPIEVKGRLSAPATERQTTPQHPWAVRIRVRRWVGISNRERRLVREGRRA